MPLRWIRVPLLALLATACGARPANEEVTTAPSVEAPPPASVETCAEANVVTLVMGEFDVPEGTPEEILAHLEAHPELVDAAIAESPDRFVDLEESRRFRHVMVSVGNDATARQVSAAERQAAALLRRIRRGEDFAEVARAESADTSTAASGGDLGWMRSGMVFAPLDEAVFGAAAVGVLPTVIRTQLGFHVVEVTGIRPAREQASMEEMRETLGPELLELSRRSVIVNELFARAMADARSEGAPLGDVLQAALGEDRHAFTENHGPFHADEAPRALSLEFRGAPEDTLARVAALEPGEVFGPIVGRTFAWAIERLVDAPCVPRFVVRGPPRPEDPGASTESGVLFVAHGLGWAHSDCYRRHALEGEPYGTLEMGALVDETGAAFAVMSDGLSNQALSHCVLSSFDNALRMRSDEGRTTLTFEISFEPPTRRTIPAGLEDLVLVTAPSPAHPLAIDLGAVEIVGWDASAETITPGVPFVLTIYWHVRTAPGGTWRTLLHVHDEEDTPRMNLDADDPLNARHPPSAWAAGTWVRDEVRFTLPSDWGSASAIFYTGLWDGAERMAVVSGPSDGTSRAIVARIPVAM